MGKLRGAAQALLLIAVACGGVARPPAPLVPGARQQRFAPLAIREDAKAPHQAVLLGTDPHDGSTIVPIAGAPARGVVDALHVTAGATGPPAGGVTPVTLSTAPAPDGAVQVGLPDALPGDAAAAWRAGAWLAAFAAAAALGKDPTDLAFSAAPGGPGGGHGGGAAAAGLLAGGFLATITGGTIDGAATIAGAIHPDGTLGPAPGLPEMFQAALAAGKKKLGYPIGLRRARSAATGELIDLVRLARARGAEAIEVADARGAHALLTGRALPATVPVAAQEMRLPDDAASAIDAAYRDWQRRLADHWAALLLIPQSGNLPRTLLQLARDAQALGERAEQLHRQGAVAAAYGQLIEAWVLAASATATFDVLQKVRQGDVPAALAALAELAPPEQDTRALLEQLGASRPTTIGGHLQLVSALQAALRGWSFQAFAADEGHGARRHLEGLAGKRKEELSTPAAADALVAAVAPAIVLLERAAAALRQAPQPLAPERAELPYACAPPDVQRLAAAFQAAAAAGVDHLDALLVEPMATRHGGALDAARLRLALDEPDYAVAYMLARLPGRGGLPQDLAQAWGVGALSSSLLALAGGELAHASAAALIARHAARSVRAAAAPGTPAAALDAPAIAAMLASADHAARASARAARIAIGAIPALAQLAYQQATAQRDGGDPLGALAAYWRSSGASQTAVRLARNRAAAPPPAPAAAPP